MRVFHFNLNKCLFGCLIGVMVFFFFTVICAQNRQSLDPLANNGLLLIEKEMIKFSDRVSEETKGKSPEMWNEENKVTYRSLLFLEDYFLNDGITSGALKLTHLIINMREATPDLKKKAFLECEAWRVLDYDFKNHENKELIEILRRERNYSKEDHVRFRQILSDRVSSCIRYIATHWAWNGPDYADELYDIKARNAVETVRSYVIFKKKSQETQQELSD